MAGRDASITVKIDLEKQPEKKEEKAPEPTKPEEPKNNLIHFIYRLTLTLFKIAAAIFTYFKSYFVKMADEERVHPAAEDPSEGSDDKPKKGRGRLGLIIKIVVAVLVIIGLANFILWVVINPRKMKFYVTDAALEEFSLSDDNTLRYNLRLNFTVRNPNKRIGFHYESIVGGAFYRGEKFDSGNLLPFRQRPKTTTSLATWFSGVKSLSLNWDAVEEFKVQKSSGFYPVDVKIRVYSSIKLGKIHMGDFKVKVKCGLKVPLLVGNIDEKSSVLSSELGGFKTTQCLVDFNPLIVIYSD